MSELAGDDLIGTPDAATADAAIAREVKRRRTFAIISHPDAGKTTLTEKLLLFGGAIQMAGTVKARKSGRHATSDWLEIEKQRGISVASSVMQFTYDDCVINLLDTPGHQDFSEDTYRVLTAVDAAVMVVDAAKGVEAQTIKLLEVCRLRNTPIITFINKMDREVRDPLEVLDEIESVLKIKCAPVTWPIGMGKRFQGVYHLLNDEVLRFLPGEAKANQEVEVLKGAQERPPRDFRLAGDREAARHLGGQLSDAVHLRRLRDQPARYPRPPGFFRGHLPRADRGGRGGDGGGRGQGRGSADHQAAGSVPPAQHADHHLHQQDGS